MLHLRNVSTREEISQRVCEIVAEQMAMDSFEVKPGDSLDADLGIAGDDVDEIFAAVHEEFGTDFSELGEYWQYYFYPEVAPMGTQFTLSIFCAVLMLCVAGFHKSTPAWAIFGSLIVVAAWRAIARVRRHGRFEANKLPLTINDIVDAVIKGRWEAPEGIWERIKRLGSKRDSYSAR